MVYDETLADRVRSGLAGRSGINERRMFGGLAFMLDGNMCCCVTERGLMVRVGPDGYEDALRQPHAGVMDMTGRPMRGWVLVGLEGLASDESLGQWAQQGAEFAGTLPPK